MSTVTAANDLASFEKLEEKIRRTVDLVTRLKSENADLRRENTDLQAKVGELQSDLEGGRTAERELESMRISQEQLSKELTSLKSERQTVLQRVEGLLDDLGQIPLD